jgi:farnesyl diphosphate synthase
VTFSEVLKARATAIEAHLLAATGEPPSPLSEAMRYAASGGKRLRGFLVMESAALHRVPDASSIHAAAAIEAIHAYSLVHDDLPCMDDDDLRRGQPTVHVKWDEATAVLVGDGLQSLAFRLVADGDLPAERRLALSQSLAREAAAMVRGQALDIRAETAALPLDLAGITELQSQKTGALIEWSAVAGAIMAGADTAPLAAYARALGLAFQIADDILDETGDEAKAGKRLHKDAEAGKATFVSLLGLDGAKTRARALVAEAVDALALYDARADNLREAARFVIARDF